MNNFSYTFGGTTKLTCPSPGCNPLQCSALQLKGTVSRICRCAEYVSNYEFTYIMNTIYCSCRNLLKLLNEISYWEQLMFETPHYVAEIYQKKEDLRVLRENVLLVVRDYNRFVSIEKIVILRHSSYLIIVFYRNLSFILP